MKFLLIFLLIIFVPVTSPAEYFYSADLDLIGKTYRHEVKKGESLIEIARMFNLGYSEIVGANPTMDPFIPEVGASVVIPMSWIIPDVPERSGIVINISEMRLFYFLGQGTNLLTTFPIGIGDEGTETPVGNFTIIQKIVNPPWYPPKSIRERKPELPVVVPPGPENPLGTHALRLSTPSYLIHGTNRPWAVGRRATNGCLRLYPEDIPRLFQLVKKGEKVFIVRQPVKAGLNGNRVFIEVHDDGKVNYLQEAVKALGRKGLLGRIDRDKLALAIEEKSGIPMDITEDGQLVVDQ